MILILRLCQPQQQSLHGFDVLDDGAAHGGILPEGGHGQDGVESVVVGGAQTADNVEQFPNKTMVNITTTYVVSPPARISSLN